MKHKHAFYFLFYLHAFTGSTMASEINDLKLVTHDAANNVYLLHDRDEDSRQIKIDQAEYDSIIDTNFNWSMGSSILPLFDQNFEIDNTKSLYLDTNWRAITTATSEYPILVTSYLYECVALALMSSQKIGMFHIHPEDTNEEVNNFIRDFIDREDFNNIRSTLVTGMFSSNLSRCYEIIKENNIKIMHLHAFKIIEVNSYKTLFHPTFLDKDTLMSTPFILNEKYAKVAIDARTLEISLSFDIEKFEKDSGALLNKAKEARAAGMYVISV